MSLLELEEPGRTSCGYHRISLPFAHLQAKPRVPVYIVNRRPASDAGKVERMKQAGYRIVVDVDDYWHLDADHPLHDAYEQRNRPELEACMRAADMVWCTHGQLAEAIRPLNANVHVVPNALPFDIGQFVRNERYGATVVYAGGSSHVNDIGEFGDAMATLPLTMAGWRPFDPSWQKMARALPRAEFVREKVVDSYMAVYEGHGVAIAPLRDTFFNRCKSNLKVLEAGCRGLPIVTSAVHPYLNPQDAHAVNYAHNVHDWRHEVRRLLADGEYRLERGQALAEHVRQNYDLSRANELRRQLLESFS
jgi:glycosyltransferase involved in cell wall biosynthesis